MPPDSGIPELRASAAPARLPGADAVRVLAAFLVVVIHADHWPYQSSGVDRAVWIGLDLLARVCVPLFVALSGVLLAYRSRGTEGRSDHAMRGLRRSLLPWLFWAPVYCVIGLLLTDEVGRSATAVADWWASGGGHLYFLLLIPQLYVIFVIWPRRPAAAWVAVVPAVLIQTGLDWYRLAMPSGAPLESLLLNEGFLFFPFWIGYFALGAAAGAWLRDRDPGRNLPPILPFAGLTLIGAVLLLTVDGASAANVAFAEGTGAFLRPSLLVLTVGVFGTVGLAAERWLRRRPRWAARISALSRYSLGVYIVHEALLYIPARLIQAPLLDQRLPVSALGFVVVLATTLALALALTRLLSATPLAVTIGMSREPLALPCRATLLSAMCPRAGQRVTRGDEIQAAHGPGPDQGPDPP
jgi:surface polysaccharide O-acyltransferase-like enzyme